jgi:hypothetical protein
MSFNVRQSPVFPAQHHDILRYNIGSLQLRLFYGENLEHAIECCRLLRVVAFIFIGPQQLSVPL